MTGQEDIEATCVLLADRISQASRCFRAIGGRGLATFRQAFWDDKPMKCLEIQRF